MAIGTIFLLALSVGASFLAASLRSKPKQKGFIRDDKPTALAERGSYIPLVIGERLHGYVFAWAGNRNVVKEVTGETGGKGGSSKKTYANVYREDAMHIISVGPAFELSQIRQSGVNILVDLDGNDLIINKSNNPSGSTVNIGNEGSFKVYWGDCDQPINDMFGIASRWPHAFYLHWIQKRLGSTPQWGDINYKFIVSPSIEETIIPEHTAAIGTLMKLWDNKGVEKWSVTLVGTSNRQRILIAPDGTKDPIILTRDSGQTHNIQRFDYLTGALKWNQGFTGGGDASSGGDFSEDGKRVTMGSHSGPHFLTVNLSDGSVFDEFNPTTAGESNQQSVLLCKTPSVNRLIGTEFNIFNDNLIKVDDPMQLGTQTVSGLGTKEGLWVWDKDLHTLKGDFLNQDIGLDNFPGIELFSMRYVPELDLLIVGTTRTSQVSGPNQTASGFADLHGFKYSTGENLWRADVQGTGSVSIFWIDVIEPLSSNPRMVVGALSNIAPRILSLVPGEEGRALYLLRRQTPTLTWFQVFYDGVSDVGLRHSDYEVWNKNKLFDFSREFVDLTTGISKAWALYPLGPAEIFEDSTCFLNEGVEPSCAIKQIMTGTFPHGCAISPQLINASSLNALAQVMIAEDLGINLVISDGDTGTQIIADILQDIGAMLSEDGNALKFRTIRPTEDAPFLTEDFLLGPEPELEFQFGPKITDRIVFIFSDESKNYRNVDIQVDNDSFISEHGRPKTKKAQMPTITKHSTAASVASRRRQEELASVVGYQLLVTRDAIDLRPGQVFSVENIGSLILMSLEYMTQDRKSKLEAVMNYYGDVIPTFTPGEGFNSPSSKIILPDAPFFVFETPFSFDNGANPDPALSVVRNRGHNEIFGADVWLSGDDVSYDINSPQNAYAPGGELDENFDTTASPCGTIENGPLFTTDDPNGILQVEDLSGNDIGWRSGLQVCLIIEIVAGEPTGVFEAFFLRNIEAIAGDQFRLRGLIGCRGETDPFAHAAGARVMIFNPIEIRQQFHQFLSLGAPVSVKTQPRTRTQIQSLDTVVSQLVTIKGNALRPLPLDNFFGNFTVREPSPSTGLNNNEYGGGDDVVFRWDYRVKPGTGLGAGELPAGIAIGGDTPAPQGTFTIDVYTTGDVFVAEIASGLTTPAFTYPNATIITDHGGEISFKARVRHIDGAYASDEREITITKV